MDNKLSTDIEIDNIFKFIPRELSLTKTIKIVNKLLKYPLKSGYNLNNS